jgi:arylsulfatase A-like enzyme
MKANCLFLALVPSLFACHDSRPERVELAVELAELQGTSPRLVTEGTPEGWLRVRERIAPDHWKPSPWPDIRTTRVELTGSSTPPGRETAQALFADGVELQDVGMPRGAVDFAALQDQSFIVLGDELFLLDRTGAFEGMTLMYDAWFERGPRVTLPGVTSNGFALLSGEAVTFEVPAVAGGRLVFGTALHGSGRGAAEGRFRILADGLQVFEESRLCEVFSSLVGHQLDLPPGTHELSFEVTGGAGVALFAAPALVPAAPSEDPRPDLVVFLADTFRADNLAIFGGAPNWTPNMNAFVEAGLAFTDVHSAAPWTLPSQSSLLTSLYPLQHGAVRSDLRLPATLGTLPGLLADAGYRTVAVTDGGFVGARFGMDHGFEIFVEASLERDFEANTLSHVRDVLAMDDGRPLFLYVQSYRAHAPYFASDAARASHPELFAEELAGETWEHAALTKRIGVGIGRAIAGDSAAEEEMRRDVAHLERLYRGGVVDLDAGFGELLAELGGTLEDNVVIALVSDHGESFLEHRSLAHGTSVYEQETHVPLVFRGPGIEPGRSALGVSLVDLAPTFAQLADVAPPSSWEGRSVFDDAATSRIVFSFQSETSASKDGALFALFDGQEKVVGRVHGGHVDDAVETAFALDVDPAESKDLAAESWPRELLERYGERLEEVTTPAAAPEELLLTEAEKANLRAMGYLGD